jgi:hypothetical protein
MHEYFILIISVGVLWGSTDYLIGQHYIDYSYIQNKNQTSSNLLKIFHFIFSNYKPIFFFLLNQTGSILFYICLGYASLSLTVIISNSTTFITIMLIEYIHKKKIFSKSNHIIIMIKGYYIGLIFVITGMILCFYNVKQ